MCSVCGIPILSHEQGMPTALNPGQKYLFECWCHLADRIKKGTEAGSFNIVARVHNGDPIDGQQRLQDQLEAVTTDPVDQADNFEAISKTFATRAGLSHTPEYFVQGSEYHDGRGGKEIERIAKGFGAVQYTGLGTGRYSKEVLDLDTGYGITVNITHGISVSGGLYRATAPDREGVWSALAARIGKMPKAEVVIRSHAHYFVHVEHESKHIAITPCWELQTRFMRKHGAYRMLPTIGSLIVRVYQQEASESDGRARIMKFFYDLPPYNATKLASAMQARGGR